MKIVVVVIAAIAIVALSVAGPIIVRYARGFVAGAIWQWRELRNPTSHELIVMRLADMTRIHPEQIVSRCSECGEKVGVYPSGQRVMREIPTIKLFCQVCRNPNETSILAPGADLEPMQSKRRSE